MLRFLLAGILLLFSDACFGAVAWQSPQRLTSTYNKWEGGISFDLDSSRKVHAAWVNWNDESAKALQYTNNTSGSFSAPLNLNLTGYYLYGQQTAICITSDDVVHLAVTAKQNGSNYQGVIYYWRNPVNQAWNGPIPITPFDGSRFCYVNGLIALPDNSLYLTFLDSADTVGPGLFGVYKPATGSFGAVETIRKTISGTYPSGFVRYINGGLWAGYALGRTGAYYTVRNPDGTWASEKLLAPFDDHGSGSIVHFAQSRRTGEIAAVYGYEKFSGDLNFDIFVKFSSDGGQSWGPEIQVSPGLYLDRAAWADYDWAGNLNIVWQGRNSAGEQDEVYFRSRSLGGSWSGIQNLTNSVGRTGTALDGIRVFGQDLYVFSADAGNDTGVPGWEDAWFIRGVAPVDPTPPPPLASLGATPGEERINVQWQAASVADFSHTVVRMSTTGYPATPHSGTFVATQSGSSAVPGSKLVIPVTPNIPYYFSGFVYDQSGNVSIAVYATATAVPDVTAPAAPANFNGTADAANNVTLSWFNAAEPDFAGTIIRMSTAGFPQTVNSGNLVVNLSGNPGQSQQYVVSSLQPGTAYYFSAFAYDSKPNYSPAATKQVNTINATIGYAKTLPDNSNIALLNKIVTSTTASYFYIQEPDRSSAVRVTLTPTGLIVGDRVNVTGQVTTRKPDGVKPSERQISGGSFQKVGTGMPAIPLRIQLNDMGGEATVLLPGVVDGLGLNNIGLLVTLTGKVTFVSGSSIWVDDGSGTPDTSGRIGALVTLASGSPSIAVGDLIKVTGIQEGNTPISLPTNRRYIRTRTSTDVVKL